MILVATVMLINDGKHDIMDLENIWAPHSWSRIEHIRSSSTRFCTVLLGSLIVDTAPPLLTLHSLGNFEPTGLSDVIWHGLLLDLLPTPHHTTPHHTTPHHTTPHHTTPHHTTPHHTTPLVPCCNCSQGLYNCQNNFFLPVLWSFHSSAEHTPMNATLLAATHRSCGITCRPVERPSQV